MKHAGLKSPRIQRTVAFMSDGKEHSTREISRGANVLAVNSVIAELRCLGADIVCECRAEGPDKARRFYYTMRKGPTKDA